MAFLNEKTRGCLKTNFFTMMMIMGVFAGIGLGLILVEVKDEWEPRNVMYIAFIGDIFLRMLKALILPLIVSSLITAIGSLDISLSKKIGIRAIVYYMSTTVMAVILGIILVSTIRPGKGYDDDEEVESVGATNVTTADTLMDLLRNAFPPNLVEATIKSTRTEIVYNHTTPDLPKSEWKIKTVEVNGTNIMGLVMFATVLGITLSKMGEKGKPLLDFFTSLSEAMMGITHWVILLSPVGVCFLIAGQLINEKDLGLVFSRLGKYFATVVIGLFIHGFIVLPTIYIVTCRKLPFRFIANMTQAMATAFGTSSSSATLPITMECLEQKNHVDPRVSRFVLPIGATINMDGTALYEAAAAIFIAQMMNRDLNIGNLVAISITATAASIGAAGVPQAGLVTMVMVLSTLGFPADYVSYIVPVDWLLDRFRTAINVLGDSLGAGIVDHLSRAELDKFPIDEIQGDQQNRVDVDHLRSTITTTTITTTRGHNETYPEEFQLEIPNRHSK